MCRYFQGVWRFSLKIFLGNEDLLQYLLALSVGHRYVMLVYNLYFIYIPFNITANKTWFKLRRALLLSLSNSASVDIVNIEGSFRFSLVSEFILTLCIGTDTETGSHFLTQLVEYTQHMLKLLVFKGFSNDLFLETEYSEVILIWWFVSIESITSLVLHNRTYCIA